MSDFEAFMLEKINSSHSMERDMNEAILSLYHQGYIDVRMRDDGEPLITTSSMGKSAMVSMLFSSIFPQPIAEA
jgi:hypothetical protein